MAEVTNFPQSGAAYYKPDVLTLRRSEPYELYLRGRDHKDKINLYSNVAQCYRFYEGDQWAGVDLGNLNALVFNIIRSIGRYKVSQVLMNDTKVLFSCAENRDPVMQEAAEQLTQYTATLWERLKLDWQARRGLTHAYITGDLISYVYLDENGEERYEEIDSVNFYPGNVNEQDIQAQPYIVVVCRRPVADVRDEAAQNGLSEEEIELIVSDEETMWQASDGAKRELDPSGMCNCYLKFWKDKRTDTVWMKKSTQAVDYLPDTDTLGKRYRFAHMVWEEKKGEFHGIGDVQYLIPNQKAINMIQSMNMTNLRYFGFPKMIYNKSAFNSQEPNNAIGSMIGVAGNADDVRKAVSYLTPPALSGDTYKVFGDMLSVTKDMNGANDAALGNINPEQASGAAIAATVQQSAMPLENQRQQFYNYVEDLALNFADLWVTGNRDRVLRYQDDDGNDVVEFLTGEQLRQLRLSVRIDVGATNRWTEGLVTQALNNMLAGKYIDFETFVKLVPRSSGIPKEQLLEYVREQREAAQQAQAAQMQTPGGEIQTNGDTAMPQRNSGEYVTELLQALSPEEQQAVQENPELLEQVLMRGAQ